MCVSDLLRNAERHGLHAAWSGWGVGSGTGAAALGMPRPDPLSTAAWFPYWAERKLLVAPTQIPASVVRPAQCYLMKLAFEGAPLSFAAPMRSASCTPRQRSRARAEPRVERGQELGHRRIELRDGDGKVERPPREGPPHQKPLSS
jgi:hypothetical protein